MRSIRGRDEAKGGWIRELWNKRFVRYMTLALLGLILVCLAGIVKPNQTLRFEGSHTFESGVEVESYPVYHNLSLGPGTYSIELNYVTDMDTSGLCALEDDTVMEGTLWNNFEHFYSNLGKTSMEAWLLEGTQEGRLVVSYGGKGSLTTGTLTIYETDHLWTMLLSAGLFIWLLGLAGAYLAIRISGGWIGAEQRNVMLVLAAISLIASVPYLCGYNVSGADLTYHLQRIEGVKDGILMGQFPVRLEPRWVFEQGYANGIFYCNTFLFLPGFLRLLGYPISFSYNVYCIVLNIATVLISYGCFKGMLQDRKIALVCSGLYSLSIFRIYKLLVTSAVGEGTAVVFFPLILYGFYRIFTENPKEGNYRTAFVPLAAGLTGLVQSHVLSTEITALVILTYVLLYGRKLLVKQTFLQLLYSALVPLVLSLWFLVPFVDYYLTQDLHVKHVFGRQIQSSGLSPAHLLFHFWMDGIHTPSDGMGMEQSHPVGLGLVLAVGLIAYFLLWYRGAFRADTKESSGFVRRTALVGSMLLCMSLSIFPWDFIQTLHPIASSLVSSLQFPNRFLGWATACLVVVYGFCLKYYRNHKQSLYRGLMVMAFLGVTTSGMYLLDAVNANQETFELYNHAGMGFGYISGAEYLIEGVDLSRLTFSVARPDEGVEVTLYEKKPLGALFCCENKRDTASFVDLPLLLYKGYKARDAKTGEVMQVRAGFNGCVEVEIPPAYKGQIRVSFESPSYWRWAEAISYMAWCGLGVWAFCGRRRRHGK